jgi:hypothetical protein
MHTSAAIIEINAIPTPDSRHHQGQNVNAHQRDLLHTRQHHRIFGDGRSEYEGGLMSTRMFSMSMPTAYGHHEPGMPKKFHRPIGVVQDGTIEKSARGG